MTDQDDGDPCTDGTHCCCCLDAGDKCCDCGEVPVRASEVLAFIDFYAGQENEAEEVRDFVQLAARGVAEGKTRREFAAVHQLAAFVIWSEERIPAR
jgi:hypothetical protein